MNIKFFLLSSISFLLVLLSFSFASALELDVKVLEQQNILISELEKSSATFSLQITNLESTADYFQIYSLVSVALYPKEKFRIGAGETIVLNVTAKPFPEVLKDKHGIYAFEYQIKGDKTGFYKENIVMKIYDVKDIVVVSLEDIPLNATGIKMTVQNKENLKIENFKVIAKSSFFEFSERFDLDSEETKTFEIPIILEREISAGDYKAEITYELNNKKSSVVLPIKYLEASGISVTESKSGFIIKKTNITRFNEGNVPAVTKIEVRKNILTRLFTIYSEKPASSVRSGIFVDYAWEKEIGVGKSYTLYVTTNYTFPFIIILVIVLAGLFAAYMSKGRLSVRKSVSFVRTRGGEFALKVNLRVKAKTNLTKIVLIDRIPGHAKLFNKFGIPPHRINEHNRAIEWDIQHLNAGEERVFSYIIYSKINIVGSFELPAASASFEHDGKKEFALSNRTYFAAQTAEN